MSPRGHSCLPATMLTLSWIANQAVAGGTRGSRWHDCSDAVSPENCALRNSRPKEMPSHRLKLSRTSRPPLLTAAEVAEILNVSIRSVRRLIADGKLPIVRLGRAVRILPESLETLTG